MKFPGLRPNPLTRRDKGPKRVITHRVAIDGELAPISEMRLGETTPRPKPACSGVASKTEPPNRRRIHFVCLSRARPCVPLGSELLFRIITSCPRAAVIVRPGRGTEDVLHNGREVECLGIDGRDRPGSLARRTRHLPRSIGRTHLSSVSPRLPSLGPDTARMSFRTARTPWPARHWQDRASPSRHKLHQDTREC